MVVCIPHGEGPLYYVHDSYVTVLFQSICLGTKDMRRTDEALS